MSKFYSVYQKDETIDEKTFDRHFVFILKNDKIKFFYHNRILFSFSLLFVLA